jgi:thioredoxin-related protein
MVLGTILGTVLVSAVWAGSSGKPSLIRRLTGRAKPAAAATPIQWQPNLKEAHRVSLESGRPLLLLFGGPNCTYCRRLEAETLTDPALATYINTTFVPVHLDCVKDRREAEILEVTNVPACVVLSPQADLLGTIVGFVKPGEFTRALSQSIEFQRKLQAEEPGIATVGR